LSCLFFGISAPACFLENSVKQNMLSLTKFSKKQAGAEIPKNRQDKEQGQK